MSISSVELEVTFTFSLHLCRIGELMNTNGENRQDEFSIVGRRRWG